MEKKKTFPTQLDRVIYMENLYDRINEALESQDNPVERLGQLQEEINELETYYLGSDWLEDFDAEKRDEFPKNLNRGILTEDAIYDLLSDIDEIMER